MIKYIIISTILALSISSNSFAKDSDCVEDKLDTAMLEALRRDRIPVAIYLVNGIKLQGQVENFSCKAIILKNTISQLVYKHSISTVVPSRTLYN